MNEYMLKYGTIKIEEYFNIRTNKIKYSDLQVFKIMILSLYNKLVKLNPTSVKTIRTDNTCADYNYIHILNRKQYKSVKMIEDKYDDLFFVRLYCFCRFREEKLQLNQYEFNKIEQ